MNNRKIVSAVAVGVALATPLIGFAQPTSVSAIVDIFKFVFDTLQTLFFIVAGIFILYAAFKYLTAQGDPEKVGTARQMVIYAVIAIAVALLVNVFDSLILDLLKGSGTGPSLNP